MQFTQEDFDLPPPPEEYSNLPAMPAATLPPPTSNDHQVADWQREIAGKFRHYTPTTAPLSIDANHELPPPPSGFHDEDIPIPEPARVPPARSANIGGGLATYSSGLAGTVSGPMRSWSRDYVAHWLETLNMPEHCAAFSAASINGQRLISLTDDDLYALGVTQFGQRKMLQRAIENRGDDA